MKFSIITVCKNAEKVIERTILSILPQTYLNIEYIIVDGASTDGTVEIIKRYAEKHPTIKWISEPDSGIYQAMNKGIKLATGDIIAFLNAGDYYLDENVIGDVCDRIVNDSEHLIYSANLYGLSYDRTKFLNFNVSNVKIDTYFFFRNTLPHPSTFYRKEVFERCGVFDESFKIAGDYEHFVRCCKEHSVIPGILNVYTTFFNLDGISFSEYSKAPKKLELIKLEKMHYSKSERFFYSKRIFVKIKSSLLNVLSKLK